MNQIVVLPPSSLHNLDDPATVLALTQIGEASNQGYNGMQAIACVIMNRVKHGGWWGADPRSVCLANEQFDCWMPGADRDRMLEVAIDDPVFRSALILARMAIAGTLPDITNGADSYYADYIAPPPWANVATSHFTVQIGVHRFYVTESRPAAPAITIAATQDGVQESADV